jgi:hypothetical protein
MTELQLTSDTNDLMTWAQEAQVVHQVAQALARTSFVPKPFQGRPDEITAAILAGRELGLAPMMALRSVDVIEGRPSISAIALRGLVKAAGHSIWVEESTETRAIVCGHRRDEPNRVEKSVWTMERARKAGLADKSNWKKNPQAMLIARATSECARLVAADSLIGMPYTTEELSDGDAGPAHAEATVTPIKTRRVQRAPQPAPEPELAAPPQRPALEPVSPAPAPQMEAVRELVAAAQEPEPMSDTTRAALMATYREVGMEQRDRRMAHASQIVGRTLVSANQLTEQEARSIIAALKDELVAADEWPEPTTPGGDDAA